MQHFDLVVIGSGSGNSLIDERFAAWNVALIERDETFGGTCLNRGCIPTKMFVHPADLAESARRASTLGVNTGQVRVDWPAIRDRIFGRIDPIAAGGLEWRERSDNVTVFHGEARFVGPKTLQVGADGSARTTSSSPPAPDREPSTCLASMTSRGWSTRRTPSCGSTSGPAASSSSAAATSPPSSPTSSPRWARMSR